MKANPKFTGRDLSFWANVRAISEAIGYTDRGSQSIYIYGDKHLIKMIEKFKLNRKIYFNSDNSMTELSKSICEYSKYRADILSNEVAPNLLTKDSAKTLFNKLVREYRPTCPIPMNKQKGDKRAPSFFTAMINILLEKELNGRPIDFDPRELIKIFKDGNLTHTLSRRVDGAYPSTHSPQAIWEIKEYYYTTTFGSRVADGVYETQLDGFELEEVFDEKGVRVAHYLFVDDYNTWWNMGRSYLCRIIDMLHMGKIDEAVFGREIIEAIPRIVKTWK